MYKDLNPTLVYNTLCPRCLAGVGDNLDQNASGYLDMPRPIGASSSTNMASRDAEAAIPEPETPPQEPPVTRSRTRTRSPPPRLRSENPRADDMEQGVIKVLVRTRETVEELHLHGSQPLAMVKLLIALPDASQCVRLEYKHAQLAAHTKVSALPQDGWLFASHATSNHFGDNTHWTLNRTDVREAAKLHFHSPCQVYQGPITQDLVHPWARPRKVCGRVGVVSFGGQERPIEWLQQALFQK